MSVRRKELELNPVPCVPPPRFDRSGIENISQFQQQPEPRCLNIIEYCRSLYLDEMGMDGLPWLPMDILRSGATAGVGLSGGATDRQPGLHGLLTPHFQNFLPRPLLPPTAGVLL